jgi:hypothetical protein
VTRLPQALAPLLLAATLLAGCGKGDSEQISDLVERQAEANRVNNTTDICELLSERAQAEVAAAAKALGAKGTDCPTQLAALGAADEDADPVPEPSAVKVTNIEISGDRATARVSPVGPDADPVASFVREGDDWKLDAPAP